MVATDSDRSRPQAKSIDRRAIAKAAVERGPTTKVTRVLAGELIELEIPQADASGLLLVQRCVVWRDSEFRTASLNCATEPEFRFPAREEHSK